MTAHNETDAVPITVAGEPLHRWLADSVPGLVDGVLDSLVSQLPDYEHLPDEQLGGDIRRIIERNLRAFVEVLRTGRPTSAEALAELREAIVQRAEEGMPIDAVIDAHHLGVQVVWEHLGEHAGPDDLAGTIALNKLQLGYLRDVTTTVAAGYVQERQAVFGEEHAARQSVLSALLDGTGVAEPAGRAAIRLPPAYFVLGIGIAAHPDENRSDVDSTVAARRKLRRMWAELERRTREPVLSALTPGGGTVLVPHTGTDASTADWDALAVLVGAAGRAAGVDVTAGAVLARPEGVAEAVATARDVLDAAVFSGREPGTYRLDDLALECQVSQPGPARDRLAELLRPLATRPELLTTLRVHLRYGLSRRHTARHLHIHPNTVDYRLRRVAALTGLDTTMPGDLPRIHAALTAREASCRTEPPR